MGCNCRQKGQLQRVKNLAKIYAKNVKKDVHIFYYDFNKNLYNFEVANTYRKNVIETIKWQDQE